MSRKPGNDEPRQAAAARPARTAPFDSNVMTPLRPIQLRQPQPLEQRRNLARVVQRADRAVVVPERHHHALGARVGPVARRRRPEAVDASTMRGPRLPARCSQWMPSSKNASPPAIVSSLRQSSAVFSRLAIVAEVREHHLADHAVGEQPAQRDGERLVVIVLADQHDARRRDRAPRRPSGSPPVAGTPASRPARACRRRAPAASDRGGTAAARR